MKFPKFLLYFLILVVLFLLVSLKYGNQGYYRFKSTPLSNVYQTPYYTKLKQQITTNKKVILIGHKDDGIQQFIEYYLNQNIQSNNGNEYDILWRDVKAGYDIQSKKHPALCYTFNLMKMCYHYIHNQNGSVTKFWILNNIEGICYPMNKQLIKFVFEHSLDKILIVCRSDKHSQKKLINKNNGLKGLGFKVLKYVRPEFNQLMKGLIKYSANKTVLKNMINYYQNDLSKLNYLFLGQKPIKSFLSQFKQQFKFINQMTKDTNISKTLQKLCKKGQIKSPKNQNSSTPNINIVYQQNKGVLWSSTQALYAYQMKSNTDCISPKRYAQPRQIISIPQLQQIFPPFEKKSRSEKQEQEQQL